MDGYRLARLVARGYERAGHHLGLDYDLWRPARALNPLLQINRVGTKVRATFDATTSYQFTSHAPWVQASRAGLFDPLLVQVGDYLIYPNRTDQAYFVAAMEHLAPPLCVICNSRINVRRPGAPDGLGAVGYSGSTPATEVDVMRDWPASILQGGSGQRTDPHLPGDAVVPGWNILLPALPGIDIEFSDLITDHRGRRMLISSAERTGLGWRISARLAQV
ncbi:hypothetical protein [Roseomonas mucosa]|uniref:hypothetical protein n=1 Tax=Roseomonas mucosa TaxID=207340 RepID=UPI0022478988|nr:hypothetical protein [Roseomonas mucosa]UZO91762.1 Hypothetical protein RMP42_05997 [Roseomonas mucosa]